MAYDFFPLMGFPKENNSRNEGENVVYTCQFVGGRIVMWAGGYKGKGTYALNLYRNQYTDHSMSHPSDRFDFKRVPIPVDCVFEAQLAINYLVQKYLPTEVTNDFSNACNAEAAAEAERGGDLPAHSTAGEAVE